MAAVPLPFRASLKISFTIRVRPKVIQIIVEARAGGNQVSSSAAPDTNEKPGDAYGAGFYVNERGEILTNSHVVHECNSLNSVDEDDHRFVAFIIKDDTANDLAVLASLAKPKGNAGFRNQWRCVPVRMWLFLGFPTRVSSPPLAMS